MTVVVGSIYIYGDDNAKIHAVDQINNHELYDDDIFAYEWVELHNHWKFDKKITYTFT